MPSLDLHYVDELIAVRQNQHGGGQGAPLIINGHRVGASLNRSCVVMLSALLQSFVEEVFVNVAVDLLTLDSDAKLENFSKSLSRWGNPSDENVTALFRRLGIIEVLDGLTWQACRAGRVKANLKQLNEVRNQIAHGRRFLRHNNQAYSLSLAEAIRFRSFALNFGERFCDHARAKAGLAPLP